MTRKALENILDRFRDHGKVADLWLRDDDAVEPTIALETLLDAAAQFSVPVTLAVIPCPTGEALAEWLENHAAVSVAVHGFAHVNHAPSGEKKRELGMTRGLLAVTNELKAGFEKLERLHGNRFIPMLVPPWNRIDSAVVEALGGTGYRALSVYGMEKESLLPQLNTHIDPVDWHGTRGCRDHDTLYAELATRLAYTFEHGGTAGFLTHHLVHDQSLKDFIAELFAITAQHTGCRWRDSRDLINLASPENDVRSGR